MNNHNDRAVILSSLTVKIKSHRLPIHYTFIHMELNI